jgi:hypothetical protein
VPGRHSVKEKRMARHIVASERRAGRSKDKALRIAWGTVNKRHKRRR